MASLLSPGKTTMRIGRGVGRSPLSDLLACATPLALAPAAGAKAANTSHSQHISYFGNSSGTLSIRWCECEDILFD